MPNERPLLPHELSERIPRPESHDDETGTMADAVEAGFELCDPIAYSVAPARFEVPIATSLFLYRREPKRFRETVVKSLGPPAAKPFGGRVAAAAREAFTAGDWKMLGRLVGLVEIAMLPVHAGTWQRIARYDNQSPSDSPLTTTWAVDSGKLQGAFLKALDFSNGHLPPADYVNAALGCLTTLPKGFIPPDDLSPFGSPADASHHKVLRMFCRKHTLAWQQVPNSFAALRKIDHPLLRLVADRLESQKPGKPPRKPLLVRNPFKKLAAGVITEQKHKRSRRRGPDSADARAEEVTLVPNSDADLSPLAITGPSEPASNESPSQTPKGWKRLFKTESTEQNAGEPS